MALNGSLVFRFFLLICTITGLNAAPRNSQSLGILSELLSKDSNSPLIVVVDSPNHVRTIDLEASRSNSKSHKNSNYRHDYDKDLAKDAYDAVVYDILRTNQILLENQRSQGSNRQIGVAEQCSDSNENSCSKDGKDGDECKF